MREQRIAPETVEAYIAGFPPDVRAVLRRIRATIRRAAPAAVEKISWGMPAYSLDGVLTFFAGFKGHVSVFPGPEGIEKFKKELAPYGTSRGTVRFPLGTPVPYGLIGRIVKFRAKENKARAAAKRRKVR